MKVFGKISNKSGNYNPYIFGFSLSMGLLPRATLHILQKMSSIPTSQRTDMVRRSIITPEAVWKERITRQEGWLIRVIRREREEEEREEEEEETTCSIQNQRLDFILIQV